MILWSSSWRTLSIPLLNQRISNSNGGDVDGDGNGDGDGDCDGGGDGDGDGDGNHKITRYDALSRKLHTQESEGTKSSERAENVEVVIFNSRKS